MKKIIGLSFIAAVVSLTSCKKDYDPGTTKAQPAANNWWVTLTLNGEDVGSFGTFLLTTYNAADDKDSIWVDDLQNSWWIKCKAKVDYSNLTFQTKKSQNQYYDINVGIDNGKILPKAGHSKSGVVTDSIYMETSFSDDPGDTWIISGTARTGLVEDDY